MLVEFWDEVSIWGEGVWNSKLLLRPGREAQRAKSDMKGVISTIWISNLQNRGYTGIFFFHQNECMFYSEWEIYKM